MPSHPLPFGPLQRRAGAFLAAGLLGLALLGPVAQAANPPSGAGAVATAVPPGVKVAQAPRQPSAETRPAWNELSGAQQKALQPLAGTWPTLSEGQKRKWIEISRNYGRMSPEEQGKLHSRMTEWVALSPQQRAQARLNFGETQNLSPDDKKAKWEAYQALSPEEKRKLAAGATTRTPPPTAAPVKPVPAQKLANVPRGDREAKSPRITAGPLAQGQQPAPLPPAQPTQAN